MIETDKFLDDVTFAGAMLEKEDLSNADVIHGMSDVLRPTTWEMIGVPRLTPIHLNWS